MNLYNSRFYQGETSNKYWASNTKRNEESYRKLLDKAIELHQKGVAGDTEAINEAFKLLGEIRVRVPQDNLVNAYYGSIMILIGRDTVDLMKRYETSLKGLKIIDRAVEKEPDNIQIRILRANICSRLPEIYFHRTVTAIKDYNYLISRYEKDSNVFPVVSYNQFLNNLRVAYHNLGQAEEAKAIEDKLRAKNGAAKNQYYFNKKY